jgi:hypothetical protein
VEFDPDVPLRCPQRLRQRTWNIPMPVEQDLVGPFTTQGDGDIPCHSLCTGKLEDAVRHRNERGLSSHQLVSCWVQMVCTTDGLGLHRRRRTRRCSRSHRDTYTSQNGC